MDDSKKTTVIKNEKGTRNEKILLEYAKKIYSAAANGKDK